MAPHHNWLHVHLFDILSRIRVKESLHKDDERTKNTIPDNTDFTQFIFMDDFSYSAGT